MVRVDLPSAFFAAISASRSASIFLHGRRAPRIAVADAARSIIALAKLNARLETAPRRPQPWSSRS